MSHGIPVIAFNNSAMPYTVNNNNGRLVINKSVDGLTEALENILLNNDEFQRCRKGAMDTYINLPELEMINKEYEQFFQMLKNDR